MYNPIKSFCSLVLIRFNCYILGQRILGNDGNICTAADSMPGVDNNRPSGGSEWVELFVQEMMNASDMDDARSRATRALEVLEKSIVSRVSPESTQNVQKVLHFPHIFF